MTPSGSANDPQGPALPPRPGRTPGPGKDAGAPSGRRWPWIVATVAVLAAGGLILAWATLRGEPPAVEAPPPPLIEAAEVTAAAQLSIRQTGFVRPLSEVTVASEITARIAEIAPGFRRGLFVAEGAALVRLQTRELDADVARGEAGVARAEAALAEARVERDRQEQLEARDFASEATLQQAIVGVATAEADLSAARADLVAARSRLGDAVITAPFDALVTQADADVGDIATAGAALGRLVASEAAEVDLGLTPADLALLGDATLAVGGRVLVRPADDGRDAPLAAGIVTAVGPSVDAATRTVPLIVRIPRPFDGDGDARALRVDELVDLELPVDLSLRDAVSVPVRAIKGDDVVWTVTPADGGDGTATLTRQPVRILRRETRRAVLQAPPGVGALVMVSDLSGAADGVVVRLARDGEAGAAQGGTDDAGPAAGAD